MNSKKLDKEYKTLLLLSAVFSFILPVVTFILIKMFNTPPFNSEFEMIIGGYFLVFLSQLIRTLSMQIGFGVFIYTLLKYSTKRGVIVYLISILYTIFYSISLNGSVFHYLLFQSSSILKPQFLTACFILIFYSLPYTVVIFFLITFIVKRLHTGRTDFQTYIMSSLVYELFHFILKTARLGIGYFRFYSSTNNLDIELARGYSFSHFIFSTFTNLLTCVFYFIVLVVTYFLIQKAFGSYPRVYKNQLIYKLSYGTLKISRAGVEQADEMGSISALSWKAAYAGIIPNEYLSDITSEKRAEKLRSVIPSSQDEFYLAAIEQYPAGVLVLGQCRDADADSKTGEICALYYLPQFWGQGFGVQTMQFALSRLQELGFTKASLWVLEENELARRFYEKCGFVTDGSKKEITLGTPLTEVRYLKSIAAEKHAPSGNVIFGEPQPEIEYAERTGIYAVMNNEHGDIGVMKTPRGYFLPGGGINVGESHETCLKRELLEETGYNSIIGHFIGKSEYYSNTPPYVNHLTGFFYRAELTLQQCMPADTDHELVWLPPEHCISSLKLPHQVWAVMKAMEQSAVPSP